MTDPVNHPAHYTTGGIETIDAIEAWGVGFHLGNVVKYVSRADRKGSPLEDLRKAQWYLAREISRREALEPDRPGWAWNCHYPDCTEGGEGYDSLEEMLEARDAHLDVEHAQTPAATHA